MATDVFRPAGASARPGTGSGEEIAYSTDLLSLEVTSSITSFVHAGLRQQRWLFDAQFPVSTGAHDLPATQLSAFATAVRSFKLAISPLGPLAPEYRSLLIVYYVGAIPDEGFDEVTAEISHQPLSEDDVLTVRRISEIPQNREVYPRFDDDD